MNTPPRVRTTRAIEIPPTPRHGARFDSPPPTSRKPKGPSSSSSFSTATLSPPPSSPLGPDSLTSFEQIRKHRKRRASVLDEPIEKPVEVESEGWKELEKTFGKDFGRGPTVVNPAGRGLPTPSKTPARKRKHLSIESLGGSARRLFGSSSFAPATASTRNRNIMPTKSRKGGIGRLGLLGEDEGEDGPIDIFTDSNAQVPEFDPNPDNPFITRPEDSKKKRQGKKAKKAEAANKLGDDGRRDDGMVYIFRGKKMFRKFSELDEIVDPLPKNVPKTVPKPLPAFFGTEEDDEEEEFEEEEDEEVARVLNKRSTFRPRLLFPSKEAEEEEPSEEEEVETDIEEEVAQVAKVEEITATTTISVKKEKRKINRSTISRLTPESDDDLLGRSGRRVQFKDEGDVFTRASPRKSTRKRSIFDEAPTTPEKKKSPIFDAGLSKPTKSLSDKETEKGGTVKEKRKRARAGSFDAPGLHTPRKEKKTRGTMA